MVLFLLRLPVVMLYEILKIV
uniref:Uncharacterized protein n=1 Tax=Anguilla anguilla TaxID=7936 RepID=A0A0E9T1K6_ANGAN